MQAHRMRNGLGGINPNRSARDAAAQAAAARQEVGELRALPVADAAKRLDMQQAATEKARHLGAERGRRLSDPFKPDPDSTAPTETAQATAYEAPRLLFR